MRNETCLTWGHSNKSQNLCCRIDHAFLETERVYKHAYVFWRFLTEHCHFWKILGDFPVSIIRLASSYDTSTCVMQQLHLQYFSVCNWVISSCTWPLLKSWQKFVYGCWKIKWFWGDSKTIRKEISEAKQYSRGSCHVFASKLCSLLCYSSLSTHNSTL